MINTLLIIAHKYRRQRISHDTGSWHPTKFTSQTLLLKISSVMAISSHQNLHNSLLTQRCTWILINLSKNISANLIKSQLEHLLRQWCIPQNFIEISQYSTQVFQDCSTVIDCDSQFQFKLMHRSHSVRLGGLIQITCNPFSIESYFK